VRLLPKASLAFLDANILAKPVTRTLLWLGSADRDSPYTIT